MTSPFKTMSEYNDFFINGQKTLVKKQLLAEADLAAAWGVPDHENIGYSQSDLCAVIRKLRNYIDANMPD